MMSSDAGYSDLPDTNPREFIAGLDVGTTNIRCLIVNYRGIIVGQAIQKVTLHKPHPGWTEINPEKLYASILEVIHEAIHDANIPFSMVKSLGISTHRATFVTWKKDTGEMLHNFITWQDTRAEQLVKDLNSSWSFSSLRGISYLIHKVSGSEKFKLISNFNISCTHVSARLLWVISNFKEVRENLDTNNLLFGTLDSWLHYKLTNGRIHVTDVSNASATGFFDLFSGTWGILPYLLKIPFCILPKVVDNDFNFGCTSKEIFGEPLDIGTLMGDQMASLFGTGCYNENDLKITIGTGAFLNINTGEKIHSTLNGMYPMVGWRINNKRNFMLEIPCGNCGSDINWLQEIGLINDPDQSSDIAYKVQNSNGICFVPNSELQAKKNIDDVFIGIQCSSTPGQKVRAVLESIAYRIILAFQKLLSDRKGFYKDISVDGGVAKNDFICQLLADLSEKNVKRLTSTELSGMGVAYVAGLTCKFWNNIELVQSLQKVEKTFFPTKEMEYRKNMLKNFEKWVKLTYS